MNLDNFWNGMTRERAILIVCSLFLCISYLAGCGGSKSTSGGESYHSRQHPDTLTAHADHLAELGDGAGALALYGSALQIDPEHTDALRASARLNEEMGNIAAAGAYFLRLEDTGKATADDFMWAAQSSNKPIPVLERGFAQFPKDNELRAELGHQLVSAGRIYEGVPYLRQAATRSGPSATAAARTLADIHFERGDYDQALPYFMTVTKTSPDDFRANMRIAYIFYDRGRFKKASRHYKTAVDAKPESIDARIGLGKSYEEDGKTENAIHAYDRAIRQRGFVRQMDPVILAQCVLLNKTGRFDKTVALIEQAEASFPISGGLRCAYGMALAGEGLYDDAILAFRKAASDQQYSEFAREQIARVQRLR